MLVAGNAIINSLRTTRSRASSLFSMTIDFDVSVLVKFTILYYKLSSIISCIYIVTGKMWVHIEHEKIRRKVLKKFFLQALRTEILNLI